MKETDKAQTTKVRDEGMNKECLALGFLHVSGAGWYYFTLEYCHY